jgi:hypothetical protein
MEGAAGMFTYTELEDYAQNLNNVKINVAIVQDIMHGAYPDNGDSVDLTAALEQAALLVSDAAKLLESISALITK